MPEEGAARAQFGPAFAEVRSAGGRGRREAGIAFVNNSRTGSSAGLPFPGPMLPLMCCGMRWSGVPFFLLFLVRLCENTTPRAPSLPPMHATRNALGFRLVVVKWP